jgi:hypothetical protein
MWAVRISQELQLGFSEYWMRCVTFFYGWRIIILDKYLGSLKRFEHASFSSALISWSIEYTFMEDLYNKII